MAKFIVHYLGGNQPASEEEGQRHFKKYQDWLTSLGDSVIKPMVPHKNTVTLSPDGTESKGSQISMSGHTLIQADSIESAVTMMKNCPFLEIQGSLEVSEIS